MNEAKKNNHILGPGYGDDGEDDGEDGDNDSEDGEIKENGKYCIA